MSTIGGLLMPQFKPYDLGGTLEQANRIAGGQTNNQTALLQLADLKARQQAEQEYLRAIQNNPALAQQLLGGSVLGSLGPAGGPTGGGAMMQQTTMPGQPPAAPQMAPGGQDLSQFATQGQPGQNPRGFAPEGTSPPQSILASLGPAGQPQAQMQNPLLAMAQRDPRAALMLQQQMQAQQDRQMQVQAQRLKMGSAMLGSLGQMAQGVTDQAGWDQLRQDAAQIDSQLAARLPQVYSKEVRDRVVTQALDVKEAMTLQVQDLTAQAAMLKARREGRKIEYGFGNDIDAAIYERMKGQPPDTIPSPDVVAAARKDVLEGKVAVSGAQGVEAARIERTEKPLEGAAGKDAANLKLLRTMTDDIAALRKDDFTGPIVGRTGYVREQAGRMDQQEVAFRSTLQNMKDILGRLRSGANIPAPEMANLERLLPTANDLPPVFQSKMQSFQRALEQQLESITSVGTTGRQQLREETKPTTPRVGEQSTSQGTTGAGSKPASQMSREEIAAEIAAIKKRGGS